MSLEQITERLRARVGPGIGLKRSIKLDFGADGVVRIDDSHSPPTVDNQDLPADCTVRLSQSDFAAISAGTLNPQMAFMMGKLKIDGDLSVALQLGTLLG